MTNLAALRAAVFSLSAKNLRGGRITAPPAVRGLTLNDINSKCIANLNSELISLARHYQIGYKLIKDYKGLI